MDSSPKKSAKKGKIYGSFGLFFKNMVILLGYSVIFLLKNFGPDNAANFTELPWDNFVCSTQGKVFFNGFFFVVIYI